ncbi:MAG: electron transfer flavoprotein subunit beta, partial [Tissierellales bacterium]|nr:electron transfer flavoprotein subunit beta [Tissierellales bacterium]
GKQRAKKTDLPSLTVADMNVDETKLGLKGSPTRVVKIETPKVTRGGTIVTAKDDDELEAAVDKLVEFLKSKEIV